MMDVLSYALSKKYTDEQIAEQKLKVAKVEKELNDYKSVMAQVNINQEAKQKASGYSIVSLPKNAAEGQVSAVVKGETLTNLIGNSRLSYTSITTNDYFILSDQVYDHTIPKSTLNLKTSTEYTIVIEVKTNTLNKDVNVQTDNTIFSGANHNILAGTTGKIKIKRTTRADFSAVSFDFWLSKNIIDITGIFECRIMILEGDYTDRDVNYISNTKSTISASRLKSVGKNIWGSKKAADDVVQIINNSNYAYLTNIDGRNCLALVGHSLIRNKDIFNKFKPNTQYTIQVYAKRENSSYNGGLLLIKYTDGSVAYVYPPSDVWSKVIYTSVSGKTIESIQLIFSHSDYTNYFDYDTLQLEEGTQATEYEPYKETVAYLPNVVLRSLPNGVKDEVSSDGKKTQRISNDVIINGDATFTYQPDITTNYTGFKRVNIIGLSPAHSKVTSAFRLVDSNGFSYPAGYEQADTARLHDVADNMINLFISNARTGFTDDVTPTSTDWKNFFASNPHTLNYQLAEPVEIPVQVSGTLLSYPSGTVYVENVVADAGLYSDGITVLHQDLPIKSIEKISKIDYETGLETILDASKAVIASDKLSFTHPDLKDGDIVFFIYEYDRESTIPEVEVEFYDSRYVVKDSATGKFYKWSITVTNGTPSIQLTEV